MFDDYKEVNPSVGFLTKLQLGLWGKSTKTFGNIDIQYLFSHKVEYGPIANITMQREGEELPEEKIGFGHFSVVFIIGFYGK